MNREIFLGWLRVNTLFFITAFSIALLLASLFPDTMLGFVRCWGARSIAVSSNLLGEALSDNALFVKILVWNCLVTALFFIASLFILAPLIAVMNGTFFSLGLMSAVQRGIVPFWHPPVLIAVESLTVILTISFASALGTELFGVKPERKEIADFWKKNWMKLFPEQKGNWRDVFGDNRNELLLFTGIILVLLLFGAWFEVLV